MWLIVAPLRPPPLPREVPNHEQVGTIRFSNQTLQQVVGAVNFSLGKVALISELGRGGREGREGGGHSHIKTLLAL